MLCPGRAAFSAAPSSDPAAYLHGRSSGPTAGRCSHTNTHVKFAPLSREHAPGGRALVQDRKSTRLNSSHVAISYAVFCLKKKKTKTQPRHSFSVLSYFFL